MGNAAPPELPVAETAFVPPRDPGEPRDPAEPRRALSDRLPAPWLFPLLVFGITWGLIVATWHVANAVYHASLPWSRYFLFADAAVYHGIAAHGYAPHGHLHLLPGALPPMRDAYFPLLPLLVKTVSDMTSRNLAPAELIVQIVAGALACLAVWALTSRIRDHRLADRTVLLLCAFPGAMTFGMLYSEPLGIALAAASLLAAANRMWLISGLLGLLATAAHPTLIVLAPALAVAAVQAVRERREWGALIAPALAPLGFAGYIALVGSDYNDYLFLPRLEQKYWHAHLDWGAHALRTLTWTTPDATRHPLVTSAFIVLLAVAVIGVTLMIKARVPLPVTVYTVLLVVSWVITSSSGPRPRDAWVAFGIFIGAADKLPRWLLVPLGVGSAALTIFLIGWWPHHPHAPAPLGEMAIQVKSLSPGRNLRRPYHFFARNYGNRLMPCYRAMLT